MRIRWLLLLAVAAAAAFVAWRSFRTGSTPGISTPNGVASLERVRLGGLEQWILVRGEDASNPVLLWLHGGPGGAMMPIAHLLPRELERHFVVVHWDQRGAGKSYDPALPDEAFTLDHYVSDAIELSERLRERFGVERIFLLGHSWGAALGVLAAARRPDLFHAYIGMGQNVDNPREEEIGLRWVREQAEKRGDAEALHELEGLEPPYLENPKQILVQRKWLARYGGEVYGGVRTVPFFPDLDASLVWASLRSPEYSWRDLLGHQNGARRSRWAMHQEFKRLRLPDVVTRLDVPVWFLVGRHDYNTPFELVEEYYQELVAPRGKHLVWFEESAHTPALEEPERFVEVLVFEILPAVLPAR